MFFVSACKSQNNRSGGIDNNPEFSFADYQQFLHNRFNKEDSSFVIKSSGIEYFDTLKSFYSSRDFHPLFIKDFENTSSVNPILDLFSNAWEHGIQPALYHLDLIKNEISKMSGSSAERYLHMSNAELLLSDAVLKYAYHLRYGVVDPNKIFPDSYSLPVIDSVKRDIFKPFNSENIFEYLKGLQPKNPQYKKLQAALKHFNDLDTSGWKKIKNNSQTNLIVERLALLGFIDTTKINMSDFNNKGFCFYKGSFKISNSQRSEWGWQNWTANHR